MTPSVEVVMTVFNRKSTTLECLARLKAAAVATPAWATHVTIIDDGSGDGTAEAIRSAFPGFVTVHESEGNLFWARGMARAMTTAARTNPEFILWLNDDVRIDIDSLLRLESASREATSPTIVVGAMRGTSQTTTYGGLRLRGKRPGNLESIDPTEFPMTIDTFQGNLVLIPRDVYSAVGTVDAHYAHGYGDIDYGLRTKAAGFNVILAPGHFGHCDRNSPAGTWTDQSLSRFSRMKLLTDRKAFPVKSHFYFNRVHGGWMGPANAILTYLSAGSRILRGK